MSSISNENIITACTHSTKTCTIYENRTTREKLSNDIAIKLTTDDLEAYDGVPITGESKGMNILGLIIFSMVLGVVISIMEEEGRPLRKFFKALESAMMKIISLVIW
uniref:Amino acid transporter n=1 Tax=Romanomermis culicivorax TaxID=13658 RepID=A0A915IIW6_ROMCU